MGCELWNIIIIVESMENFVFKKIVFQLTKTLLKLKQTLLSCSKKIN